MASIKKFAATNAHTQKGAALLVALVILAAITLIGVSNMQSTSMEMRMTGSMIDRNQAFALVGAALNRAESELVGSMAVRIEDLYTDSCTTGQCFTNTCANGLCFYGEWLSTDTDQKLGCDVVPSSSTSERTDFWRDETIWSNAASHRVFDVQSESVKVIYEFLCFIDVDLTQPSVGEPLFRITAYLEAESGRRAPIMLQSTYALPW